MHLLRSEEGISMPRKKLKLNLSPLEKEKLESMAVEPGMRRRCSIILLTEEGLPLQRIAETLGLSKTTVNTWRQIYRALGLGGLTDRRRPGRPPKPARKAAVRRSRVADQATFAAPR